MMMMMILMMMVMVMMMMMMEMMVMMVMCEGLKSLIVSDDDEFGECVDGADEDEAAMM